MAEPRPPMLPRAALIGIALFCGLAGEAHPAGPPLVLEATIPLGPVRGRIDHLAIDGKRQRLFVAELGNDTLGIVDLKAGKLVRTVTGLREPQGVGYEPQTDTVYVADAGDGAVHIFGGGDLAPQGRVDLGEDADNVRVDIARKRVLVGYGSGAIALIDPTTRTRTGEFALRGHPESFQLDAAQRQIFVNVPSRREIAIIDLATAAVRSVSMGALRSNFPMAVDRQAQRIVTVFRRPPVLVALSDPGGQVVASAETCADADDVFADAKRHRLYVSCGEGVVDTLEARGRGYVRVARVPTVPGARTSLFVPEIDRLFVAARAAAGRPAAIWVFRPTD